MEQGRAAFQSIVEKRVTRIRGLFCALGLQKVAAAMNTPETGANHAAVPATVARARDLLERIKQLRALRTTMTDATPGIDASSLAAEDRAVLNGAPSNDRLDAIDAQICALDVQLVECRREFGAHVQQALKGRMNELFPGDAAPANTGSTTLDAANEVLNEEGLPFVDPLEMLPDSPPQTPQLDAAQGDERPTGNVLGRTPGTIEPFSATMRGEERRRWMDSLFDELEAEEAREVQPTAMEAARIKAQKEVEQKRAITDSKRSSSDVARSECQAAPTDTKPTTHSPQTAAPTQPFASLRRGFLERPKKQVRIAAPPSDSEEDELQPPRTSAPSARLAVASGMHPDDVGVQEEAARIVQLLGPEVIRGHPNAERILAEMETSQPQVVQKPAPSEPAKPAKPAVGEAVVERDTPPANETKAEAASERPRKMSAFKRRQIERQEASDEPDPHPMTPSVSLGVPAIERAARADEPLAKAREQAGLPPQVPHARPTKAYAAKLEQRAKEAQDASSALAMDTDESAPPPGPRRVRFGEATVQEAEPMDEEDDGEWKDSDEDHPQEADLFDSDESDDSLWDSDDEYTAEDLEALRPNMDERPEDEFWNEQLAIEYAAARARLAAAEIPRPTPVDDDGPEEEYGIAPLSASVGDDKSGGRPHVSRFKAARLAGERVPNPSGEFVPDQGQQRQRADEAGHELAHEHNSGKPIMVLPSLAPVRFPRPVEGDGIDLDGESDEDDERLHALMRARLELGEQAAEKPRREAAPPAVGRSAKKA